MVNFTLHLAKNTLHADCNTDAFMLPGKLSLFVVGIKHCVGRMQCFLSGIVCVVHIVTALRDSEFACS